MTLIGIYISILYISMFYVYVICYYIDMSRLHLKFKILIVTNYVIMIFSLKNPLWTSLMVAQRPFRISLLLFTKSFTPVGVSFSFSFEGKITCQWAYLSTSNTPKHFTSIGKFCVLTSFFLIFFSHFFFMFFREKFYKTVL